MNASPIFFKTTYFSDYILVPSKSTDQVKHALEQRGFAFSPDTASFVSPSLHSPSLLALRSRPASSPTNPPSSRPGSGSTPPSTPPATSVAELQARTFARLRRNSIFPMVDQSIRLVSCAGKRDASAEDLNRLQLCLTSILLETELPSLAISNNEVPEASRGTRFLSMTLTATEPISLFCERNLLQSHITGHPTALSDQLLGSGSDSDAVLVPITLDLRDLPLEATGIVCGVAGRLGLVGGSAGSLEISFLSTARAGTVLVREADIDTAVQALEEAVESEGRVAES